MDERLQQLVWQRANDRSRGSARGNSLQAIRNDRQDRSWPTIKLHDRGGHEGAQQIADKVVSQLAFF
jgi:hypothetical protein